MNINQKEQNLTTHLNKLLKSRIALTGLGFLSFLTMLITANYFDKNAITFKTCCIHMTFHAVIILFAYTLYNIITHIHDDICYTLRLFDEISYVKQDKQFDPEAYEQDIIELIISYNNQNNYFNTNLFDIQKTTNPVDKSTEIKFRPMINGRFIKTEQTISDET